SIIPLMREHKELRFLITPSNYLSSAYKVIFKNAKKNTAKKIIDPKPKLVRKTDKPIALILVIGETVRAKNWGLSGYERQTTPELKKRNAINFTNVKSCGTDTETSLPCMFSIYGRRNYNENLILNTESILALIKRAGVKVIWRENQSGSKGVADGVEYESFTNRKDPLFCNETRCYDEILNKDLNEKITSEKKDILIVLHTLGNHGPAYYQRYPDKFKKFIPTCDTAKLETCSKEQIVNTYDNAILYTDYFLSKTIDILKEIKTHKTALIYISDHGESLGEKNLYLHGIPYYIAPQEQTHVPLIIWFSENFKKDINMKCLTDKINLKLSHDNLPHTLLGLFGINSSAYEPEMDISHRCFK
ncbi:MAG: sulfatase-like hydrolase/transferase, partial [Elusimicrobiales bacterium]|nr:sulfatase-like hydrolase/transferase [Elusimicrobiales bacterium]